jgi:hypothetical protein
LEANLPSIVEACPDADLNGEVAFEVAVLDRPAPTGKALLSHHKATGSKPVTVRLDDEDEETAQPARAAAKSVGSTVTSVKSSTSIDQDFLAEADALLNS